jgi:hypothetical protein
VDCVVFTLWHHYFIYQQYFLVGHWHNSNQPGGGLHLREFTHLYNFMSSTQRSRHLAATQAVNRSLADVEEVLEAGDPAEIGDLHKQLQEQRDAMTAMAVELGDEQLNAIAELQTIVDKSLRRLNRKRRELLRGTAAGSTFSPAPSEEGGDGGGDNALPIKFALPSAEEQNVTTAEAGLSGSQLQQLLTTLAGGVHSKLPPPSWPKFNDSYRSFFAFKDELEAFIKDYGQGTSDRTLAQQIKNNCLSKSSAAYVEWAHSPAAILETLGGLFGRPSRLVESLLEPVRKQKRIQMDDYPSLLAYFTTVRNVLQEVKRLNQMQLFNTVANMDLIVERLPTNELERWMEKTEGLRDNQLASALEKFVLERWRHCGTVVARTTTAEQALKAIAGGGGHQQGGGKPASPNSKRKNKPPFKKTGGGPPNQVPAGQGGQGGQNAQPGGQQGSVVAAGAAASKQQQGGASNTPKPQNQVQKWQPAPAAPAAVG